MIRPQSGGSRKFRQRRSVDLPVPEGPMIDDALAGGDVEVDAVEHGAVAEALGQPLDADHRAKARCSRASIRRCTKESASTMIQ